MADHPAAPLLEPDSGLAPAASSGARPSGHRCPGCSKEVDALRAGHVSISEGVFLYYCNATCKALHLRSVASLVGEDVPTLDPPAVFEQIARARPEGEPGESIGAEPLRRARDSAPAPPSPLEAEAPEDVGEDPGADAPAGPQGHPPAAELEPSGPATVRSPALPDVKGREPDLARAATSPAGEVATVARGGNERIRRAVATLGGVAGLLVPLLVIADVALGLRLALAAIAALALAVHVALAEKDAADVSSLVVAGPVAGATAVAIAAYLLRDPHAAGVAVLAGLGASFGLAAEEAIANARRSVDAARAQIVRALDVPSRVLRGDVATIARDEVKAGEPVLLEAGDVVGVDGVVAAGHAVVVPWHRAPGEVTKKEGDAVVAGARVVSGRLRIVTAWAGGERAWARAATSPAVRPDVSAPIARLGRSLFERGVPAAALVAGVAAALSGGAPGWTGALAAACAAAMAFGGRGVQAAVALVHARAHIKSLDHGIVYRDARAFDAAGRVAVAVVCSRGTVLTGEPEIVALERIAPASGPLESESHILALAAGAETASTHPFADAILRAARTRGVRPESVRSGTGHAGLGVTALSASGDRLVVGSRALLLQQKVSVAVAETRVSELEAQGRSVLLVSLAGKLVGLLALQDGLRAGARAAVQRLLDARIEPVLLSGESRETCETLARALDIDHVRPEVLPAERGAEVRALAEGGHLVATIGHPASDDGALGAAGLAVAMDAAGRPAGEWGVSLASDDARDAALALSLAHTARDRARAALAAGLAPAAVAFLALAFGVGPLVLGPLAMAAGVAGALLIAARVP